jgi:multimeric flavodoxin WrbA
MKIAVLFGSQRMGGTNAEIESMIRGLDLKHEITFIHMAENRVEGCAACHRCAQTGSCVLPPGENDRFQQILDCFITSDMIFIITPVYAGIPSRLAALLERMTSVFYDSGIMNTPENPLLNKKTAIINY